MTVEGVAAVPLTKDESPRQRFLLWGSRIVATLDNSVALESVIFSLDLTEVFPRLCKVCAPLLLTFSAHPSKARAANRVSLYRVLRRPTFTCGVHRQRAQRPRQGVPVDAPPIACEGKS